MLNFLGKISYGLYVYHLIILFLLGYCFKQMDVNLPDYGNYGKVAVYVLVPGLTILLSTLSYHYLEAPILKLKSKFSAVKSSSSAVEVVPQESTSMATTSSVFWENSQIKTP